MLAIVRKVGTAQKIFLLFFLKKPFFSFVFRALGLKCKILASSLTKSLADVCTVLIEDVFPMGSYLVRIVAPLRRVAPSQSALMPRVSSRDLTTGGETTPARTSAAEQPNSNN
jgi:hypothetical protein